MKVHILLISLIFISFSSKCQDILYFKDGNKEEVKVIEVNSDEIKYKKFKNIDGPNYSTSKNEISKIQYFNGIIDVFDKKGLKNILLNNIKPKGNALNEGDNSKSITQSEPNHIKTNKTFDDTYGKDNVSEMIYSTNKKLDKSNPNDMYMQGKFDGDRYYRNYTGAGAGTFFTTILLSPLAGLIPAIACSSTPPKDSNLGFPNHELSKNRDYYLGYVESAKRKISRKVWGNFGIGTGLIIILVAALGSY